MEFKSKPRVHVAVVGGGIAGLACAKALLARGASVTVYEARAAGKGALWASGGMLAGGFECAESDASPAFVSMAKRGMALWSDWAKDLGEKEIGFRVGGVISPAAGKADLDWLEAMADRAAAMGIACHDTVDLPEDLAVRSAVCFPDDGELDNRLLGPRLAAYVRNAGGIIHERQPVSDISCGEGGVRINHQCFDAAIIATGAAGHPLTDLEPLLNQIRPVKGQLLALSGEAARLSYCLRARNIYVSQKLDGRFVIGASSEPGQSDTQVDQLVIDELRRRAEAYLPMLAGLGVIETWAGVRPGTADGVPILGDGTHPGIFLALGLYRNGVLLAPAVAEMLADAVLSGRPVPAEFSARRFQ
ncbi:NAD(P)/FAD-dependent oxidoreductase [Hyphobacterium sp.]|uniref:NAD(P)/FAD-dependent oxidoreductase n=1 Tax=Hyphobacterium sp. TaxID=2004662 RepID=UPI003749C16D